MKTNVGNNVQDTSTSFATLLGVWINNRYSDILKRTNWEVVDFDYSFSLSAGSTMATLPSNFGKEISVYDATNKQEIDFIDLKDFITNHPDTKDSSGQVTGYLIIDELNSSGLPYKYMRPYYIPASAITVQMPYTIKPTALTSDGGYTILDCEDVIELGATADALRYKRQFSKARDFDILYEQAMQTLMWDKANQPNQIKTFNVSPYSRDTV
jgi:hypothetical protein